MGPMSDYSIDWANAPNPERDPGSSGVVVIAPMKGTPSPFFQTGWDEVMSYLMGESRLGVWDTPIWAGDHIRVEGVARESVGPLKGFLNAADPQANTRADQAEAAARQAAEPPPSDVSDDDLRDMGDKLRGND